MDVELWKWHQLKLHVITISALFCVLHCNLSFCWSFNNEGLALLKFKESVTNDPFNALSSWRYVDGELNCCSWYGVDCSDGKVISLKLTDLCLEGMLAPELGHLSYVKSIILRNNSFSGMIPKEIAELKELEILDLGYNNFTGPFPLDLGINLSFSILLLDKNEHITSIPPEIYDLKILSESQGDEFLLSTTTSRNDGNTRSKSWNNIQHGDMIQRRLLQKIKILSPSEVQRDNHKRSKKSLLSARSPSPGFSAVSFSPSGQPFPSISIPPSTSISSPVEAPTPSDPEMLTPLRPPVLSPNPAPLPVAKPPVVVIQDESSPALPPSTSSAPREFVKRATKSKNHFIFILSGVFGGLLIASVLVFALAYCRRNKVVTVKPWATGLSGQLQKAFVTGVPKLQRLELETACEDFSNIIGVLPNATIYKGTLSSGVEIAVTSSALMSVKDWSKNIEAQFRNKIKTLSKVNHKNFVNLIGYCEEQQPFTRMMVFEYAPNGTLFDHLHIKESERLDWGTRLRIAMGMAYCLEYMHQLNPPIAHSNLQSSAIYLTEDYAAKISDFGLGNEIIVTNTRSATMELLEFQTVDPETNVYGFGVILLEMITGRLPYSASNGSLAHWALDQVKKGRPLKELVDPTLNAFQEEKLGKLFGLIKDCLIPNPKRRSKMPEITAKLKEITTLGPDGATPKSSPLWWAELEILSSDSN